MAEQVQQGISEEELLRQLAIDKRVEVVDGKFVESDPMTAGFLHLHIIGNISDLFKPFAKKNKLGYFGSDGLTFYLHVTSAGIRTSRIPDSFFIKKENLPDKWDMSKPYDGAPDLAIEVASPGQSPDELHVRVNDYMRYGSSQVWILYPESKTVHQYTTAKTIRIYDIEDTLQVDEFFPELVVNVGDFFKTDLGLQ